MPPADLNGSRYVAVMTHQHRVAHQRARYRNSWNFAPNAITISSPCTGTMLTLKTSSHTSYVPLDGSKLYWTHRSSSSPGLLLPSHRQADVSCPERNPVMAHADSVSPTFSVGLLSTPVNPSITERLNAAQTKVSHTSNLRHRRTANDISSQLGPCIRKWPNGLTPTPTSRDTLPSVP